MLHRLTNSQFKEHIKHINKPYTATGLDNSILFDASYFINLPVRKSTKEIYEIICTKGYSTLGLILYNLYRAYKLSEKQKMYVAVSLNKKDYIGETRWRYCNFSYGRIKELINVLYAYEYIELYKGFYNNLDKSGRRTRICTTKKLTDIFDKYEIKIQYNKPLYSIRIKDTVNNNLIAPNNKKLFKQMNSSLDKFNTKNCSHVFGWCEPPPPISPLLSHICHSKHVTMCYLLENSEKKMPCEHIIDNSKIMMYRQFSNQNLREGGRFYSAIQQMPRQYRKYLTIDGSPTIELDYKSTHPTLIYNSAGFDIPTDPYIVGNVPRNINKLAFNVMINASNKHSAILAIIKELDDNINNYTYYKNIVEGLYIKHSVIADYFYTQAYNWLFYKESQIAEYIMKGLIKEREGFIAIHDSFVVRKEAEGVLNNLMYNAWEKYTGFVAKITKKGLKK